MILLLKPREGGFKFEGAENKLTVERFSKATGEGQHGNHPNYNTEITNRLSQFRKDNPNATPEQAAQFVRGLAQEMKGAIQNNPQTKVNDLFKSMSSTPAMPRDNTTVRPAPNTSDVAPQPMPVYYGRYGEERI